MAAGLWTVLDPVPNWVSGGNWIIAGADVADGRIWVLLWNNVDLKYRVVVYDPVTSDWTAKSDSAVYAANTEGTCGFRAVGNRLYHLTRTAAAMRHVAYDWTTDSYHNLTAPILVGEGDATFTNAGTARLDDDHYGVFGGYRSFAGGHRSKLARYTISTNSWENDWKNLLDGQGASNNQFAVTRYGNSDVHMHRGLFSAPTNEYQHHGFDVDAGTFHYETSLADEFINWAGWAHDGFGIWIVGGHWWTASDATDRLMYYNPDTGLYSYDYGGDNFAVHPHGAGSHDLWFMRLDDYLYTVGGGFSSDRWDESLCRFTPPFELPQESEEGWGSLI